MGSLEQFEGIKWVWNLMVGRVDKEWEEGEELVKVGGYTVFLKTSGSKGGGQRVC